MVAVGTYEAKTRLTQLLDRVERGETFIITRHGVPIARLVPVDEEAKASAESIREAIEGLRRLRQSIRPTAPGDPTIREMIEQGKALLMLVVDASVALAWVLPDENSPLASAVLERLPEESAVVPPVWSLEMTNALLMAERRGRMSLEQVIEAIAFLRRFPIEPAESAWDIDFGAGMSLARTHGLTSYDAAYIELALRISAPLATLDERMQRVAAAAGVGLYKA